MQREGRFMGVGGDRYSDRHPGGDAPRRMIGDGMQVRQGLRALGATVLTGAMLTGGIVLMSAGAAGAASASTAPGVTSNSITVGTISTQTGTLASNFSSLIYGEKAYYAYINSQGGVNGRKIDYKYALDDGGNPTTFNQLANTLINQDHVFAIGQRVHIHFRRVFQELVDQDRSLWIRCRPHQRSLRNVFLHRLEIVRNHHCASA